MSIDLSGPFRGSAAVAAGLLTRARLRGSAFVRVFPDVYIPATLDPDLATRSRAASLLVGAAEVTVPRSERRARAGLVVHRYRPLPGEVCAHAGLTMTTPPRTRLRPRPPPRPRRARRRGRRPRPGPVRPARAARGGRPAPRRPRPRPAPGRARARRPAVRLAVEYDGGEHRKPERALRDLRREADLTAAGWTVLRLRARVVFRPHEVAVLVWRELVLRG